MKRLYENIEDINIKGSPSELYSAVTAMDITLQSIAEGTERLFTIVSKYTASNSGVQYSKMMDRIYQLRDILLRSSEELNVMQNEVVAYINKVFRYEGMSETATKPNAYIVQKASVSVDTDGTKFILSDMLDVAAALRNYSERVYHHIKTINEKKNSIAAVWRDTQYDDFAEFVSEVTRNVVDAIKLFEDYVIYLEEKIKELS